MSLDISVISKCVTYCSLKCKKTNFHIEVFMFYIKSLLKYAIFVSTSLKLFFFNNFSPSELLILAVAVHYYTVLDISLKLSPGNNCDLSTFRPIKAYL